MSLFLFLHILYEIRASLYFLNKCIKINDRTIWVHVFYIHYELQISTQPTPRSILMNTTQYPSTPIRPLSNIPIMIGFPTVSSAHPSVYEIRMANPKPIIILIITLSIITILPPQNLPRLLYLYQVYAVMKCNYRSFFHAEPLINSYNLGSNQWFVWYC